MELGKGIIKKIKNNTPLRDFLLFAIVTIAFHFLYWNTNMDSWLFGPYTSKVYNFFQQIAYKGTVIFSGLFIDTPFEATYPSIKFYSLDPISGDKNFIAIMNVVADCSGIKQLLQLFMIMLVVPNKFYKRMIYFLISSIAVLFFNIVRIFILTYVLLHHFSNYQFIHDWIGRPFHYVIIFLIWVIWMEFFARKGKH
ncbi:MAG: exosortase/archaeosortase family protein [Bacteroidales bacterium]|jgi:exosortase/archaeosortase family protein|nr:exosortase/archaeosortase family protein [Bacteroidales bacterium]